VRTERGEYRSDALVINADFAKTMTSLVPDRLRRRWSDRKLAKKRYSCSTFMMYLGIEGRFDHLAHHTILLSEDYRRNVRAIEDGDAPPEFWFCRNLAFARDLAVVIHDADARLGNRYVQADELSHACSPAL
jgi:phytoene dehydrogenase-like protein